MANEVARKVEIVLSPNLWLVVPEKWIVKSWTDKEPSQFPQATSIYLKNLVYDDTSVGIWSKNLNGCKFVSRASKKISS